MCENNDLNPHPGRLSYKKTGYCTAAGADNGELLADPESSMCQRVHSSATGMCQVCAALGVGGLQLGGEWWGQSVHTLAGYGQLTETGRLNPLHQLLAVVILLAAGPACQQHRLFQPLRSKPG